jgi:AraC family transcriptional regulator, transcriptional activator of pobA
MKAMSLEEFYKETYTSAPEDIDRQIGHFNVFDTHAMHAKISAGVVMPYNRRTYYKISLIKGSNRAEYADKVIDIESSALLFATPKVPYHWLPQGQEQHGYFCIFTGEFLVQAKSGVVLDELPIFRAGGYPVFHLSAAETDQIDAIFKKMQTTLASHYTYKYDLLRNYVVELIHYGQMLQPLSAVNPVHNAAARVSSLFIELLERQFPIESRDQKLALRTAKDYADQLAVHVNHLNKVLKASTGKTTTEMIADRITQEAKILLKQTDWNISDIAYALGFEEVAHFSNFFRKHTSVAPASFRS